jgi:fructose-1-phosphate kinase PfkB-like protein/pantothenate kinase
MKRQSSALCTRSSEVQLVATGQVAHIAKMVLLDALRAFEALQQPTSTLPHPVLVRNPPHLAAIPSVLLAPSVSLDIDGGKKELNLFREDLDEVILPLCSWLKGLADCSQGRTLVGIAGGAGTGKSHLSALLALACNELWGGDDEDPWAAWLSMDAYHLPNHVLEESVSADGLYTWKELKGHSFTLDAAAFEGDLRRIKSLLHEDVSLPTYDRTLHEPVAGGTCVCTHHKLVIVEGLHLLSEREGWNSANSHFDRRILLHVPLHVCREAVVRRKMNGGRTLQDCQDHFDRVDGPIHLEIGEQQGRADISLFLAPFQKRHLCLTSISTRLLHPKLAAFDDCETKILTLGFNPALQRILHLNSVLEPGCVHRCKSEETVIGGKGQNAAVALTQIPQLRAAVAMFVGGAPGLELENMLTRRNIGIVRQQTEASMRTCYTLVGEGSAATEVIGVWEGEIAVPESQDMIGTLARYGKEEHIGGIAVMGSLPPGVGPEFYARVIDCLTENCGYELRVLVDSVCDLDILLASPGLGTSCSPVALKINAEELVAAGKSLLEEGLVRRYENEPDTPYFLRLSQQLMEKFPNLYCVAITDGPSDALLSQYVGDSGVIQSYRYVIPQLKGRQIYPIGAGDTAAAFMVAEWAKRREPREAFLAGLAAASASCLHPHNACFERGDVESIHKQIVFQSINTAKCAPIYSGGD